MTQSGDSLVGVTGLHAGYDRDLDILRGVSVSAFPGEIVCLLGPNGAGKSTLLKAIFGLVRVRLGHVMVEGVDVTGQRAHALARLGIGYVPQLANVFPRLSVQENLEVGHAASRMPRTMSARLAAIYDEFPHLADRRRQDAGLLSGGERQLLALARALMPQPRILLLDEPSAALSPIAVRSVFEHIRRINQRGVTVVMVEQNARMALSLATRGYVLEGGQNRHEGTARALLEDDRIAASYLGGSDDPPGAVAEDQRVLIRQLIEEETE